MIRCASPNVKSMMLKGHNILLKNRETYPTKKKKSWMNWLNSIYAGRSLPLKGAVQWSLGNADKPAADAFLRQWCDEVDAAKIPAFMKFANTVRAHWSGLCISFNHILLTAFLSINSKIQLAKRRVRGYRNINNFINMIYFLCGKLKFDYPLYFT